MVLITTTGLLTGDAKMAGRRAGSPAAGLGNSRARGGGVFGDARVEMPLPACRNTEGEGSMARFPARSSERLSEENAPGIELSDSSVFISLSEVIVCGVNYSVCCRTALVQLYG